LFQKGFIALGDLYTTHTRILYLGKLTSIHINSPLLNSKSYDALLDPIIYSDECEISFSDVIQIDRNISDHDATSASLRIPLLFL
jgi:hypothetical protein